MFSQGILKSLCSFLLYHPHKVDWSGFKNITFFSAMVWRKNEVLLEIMQKWIMLELSQAGKITKNHREISIATWVCYLPYVMLSQGKQILIPLEEKNWDLVAYTVSHIDIMPKWFPLSHQYRVYALSARGHPSWLVFMGTTYPTCIGFWSALLADFCPLGIGGFIACWNKRKIQNWLDSHPDVKVVGMSLGAQVAKQMTVHKNVHKRILIKPALAYKSITRDEADWMIIYEKDPVSRIGYIHPKMPISFVRPVSPCYCLVCRMLVHTQLKLEKQDYTVSSISGDMFNQTWPFHHQFLWYCVARTIVFIFILPLYLISLILNKLWSYFLW
jgi:hypothetical protein